ncbi:MAG: cobalamin B12-binding domain-containing protein [Chloroflexota bacterium]
MAKRIRVLMAKPGLDGHETGAKLIARVLRDAGMEVIYTGMRQSPEMIVAAAIDEDVDVIGLSTLSGSHKEHASRVIDLLKQKGADNIVVLSGGVIPKEDYAALQSLGVKGVFGPGTSTRVIIDFIKSSVVSNN